MCSSHQVYALTPLPKSHLQALIQVIRFKNWLLDTVLKSKMGLPISSCCDDQNCSFPLKMTTVLPMVPEVNRLDAKVAEGG